MKYVSQAVPSFSQCCLWSVIALFLTVVPVRAATTNYIVRGVVKQINAVDHQLVIAHESIPNFMEAMTMPFNLKDGKIPEGVVAGTPIHFEFHVNETESWIDGIKPIPAASSSMSPVPAVAVKESSVKVSANSAIFAQDRTPLRQFKFTNELGQPVSFSDFHGQAIALTFFFTRCPVPEFCPRLSRNFQQTERQLMAMENAPTNWHLISISFDPDRDTPEVLKKYAETYHYDPAHWSFLTGPNDKISQLARECGVEFHPEEGFFNHNFRTIIIDASNHLQMIFPTSGDLSGSIVQEMVKAARPGSHSAAAQTAASHVEIKN